MTETTAATGTEIGTVIETETEIVNVTATATATASVMAASVGDQGPPIIEALIAELRVT